MLYFSKPEIFKFIHTLRLNIQRYLENVLLNSRYVSNYIKTTLTRYKERISFTYQQQKGSLLSHPKGQSHSPYHTMCESKVALQQRVCAIQEKRSSSSTDRVLPFPTCHFKVFFYQVCHCKMEKMENFTISSVTNGHSRKSNIPRNQVFQFLRIWLYFEKFSDMKDLFI